MQFRAMRIVIILFLITQLIPVSEALTVSRTAVNPIIKPDEQLVEKIVIKSDRAERCEILEQLPYTIDVAGLKDQLIFKQAGEWGEMVFVFLNFTINLTPGKASIIEHHFQPAFIGPEYFLPLMIKCGEEIFSSEPLLFQVVCKEDGICGDGENFFNCPKDCRSGVEDGMCDGVKDGICDPDCLQFDPDCRQFCSDGTCDEAMESMHTCPKDCGAIDPNTHLGFMKLYSIVLKSEGNVLKVFSISQKTGTFADSKHGNLQFDLIDSNGIVISSYNKTYKDALNATYSIPYSAIAKDIGVYLNGDPILNISTERFMDYCGDNKCIGKENNLTCPADCMGKEAANNNRGSRGWISQIVLGVIIVIALVVPAYYIIKRMKKRQDQKRPKSH